jgi:hypothetical protein
MAAIETTADGEYIYIALEDTATGFPIVIRCARSDLDTFETVYEPGAGTAINVARAPGDNMIFYGNFGTDVGVILHTISNSGNADISPASLGSNVVNALAVVDANIFIAGISTVQDLIRTVDAGSNWTTVNSAIGIDSTAIEAIDVNHLLIGGSDGSDTKILYSGNGGTSFTNLATAPVTAAANVVSIEVIV